MSSKSTTFKGTRADYTRRWAAMTIPRNRRGAIESAARRILQGRARYEAVEAATGVPWWWIGAIHNRESGCDFRGILHNGERILGTGRKTRLVPKGRGPFAKWEEAARDALAFKGLKRGSRVWTLERCLYEAERYNGWGYRRYRGIPSPYLWSFTNQYKAGKYVADGKWSATAVDQQIGVAPLITVLMEMVPEARFAGSENNSAQTGDDIRDLQQQLIGLGHDVGPTGADGVMGRKTEAAIRNFQRAHGLKADGIVGPETRKALDAAHAPATPDVRPAGRELGEDEVRSLQRRLRDLGYGETGRIDGLWGPKTVAGLTIFQGAQSPPIESRLTLERAWVDDATMAALAIAAPREVLPERAARTAKQLRAEGDTVAKSTWWSKIVALLTGAPAVALGVLEQVPEASDKAEGLSLLGISSGVVLLAVGGGAIALYIMAQRAESAALTNIRAGRDAGPA